MRPITLPELEAAVRRVHEAMLPTPQYRWPLLEQETGTETWVKHENHTPIGAFKIRGGITYIDGLLARDPAVSGIVTATRGNHGQSQARAAAAAGLRAVIVVPHGNAREKNAAMRAFGAELVEHGADFDTSIEEAMRREADEKLHRVASFHRDIVQGVATYAYEFFRGAPPLHTVYVPIGCGSGICGLISARDALGLDTRIVGVVSSAAPAAKIGFETGQAAATETACTFADGMAVRATVPEALAVYRKGAERVVAVDDDAVAEAIRLYYRTTHNLAEGAGAAPLAALMQERDAMRGRRCGVVLCGGNIDREWFATILAGRTPVVG